MKKLILTVLTLIMFNSASFAEDPGTREEAAALLDRAIAILSICLLYTSDAADE